MERKAGMSAGRTMLPWRRLREESPGLFEGLLVWQQPSAFADAVTFSWQIRQEAAECQQQVRLVDAFAGAWTAEAKEQQWLLQQMQACVAPGCTAVSQITDTGLAAPADPQPNAKSKSVGSSTASVSSPKAYDILLLPQTLLLPTL